MRRYWNRHNPFDGKSPDKGDVAPDRKALNKSRRVRSEQISLWGWKEE